MNSSLRHTLRTYPQTLFKDAQCGDFWVPTLFCNQLCWREKKFETNILLASSAFNIFVAWTGAVAVFREDGSGKCRKAASNKYVSVCVFFCHVLRSASALRRCESACFRSVVDWLFVIAIVDSFFSRRTYFWKLVLVVLLSLSLLIWTSSVLFFWCSDLARFWYPAFRTVVVCSPSVKLGFLPRSRVVGFSVDGLVCYC